MKTLFYKPQIEYNQIVKKEVKKWWKKRIKNLYYLIVHMTF